MRRETLSLCFFRLILALSLLLTGCKGTTAPKVGEIAPTVSCNDVAGEYVDLNKLKGNVVILYFWSSRCCGDKLKLLEPLYLQQKYNGLSILAVEVGGTKDAVASFARGGGLTFTVLTDEFESLAKSYRVIGFPTIFVVDKKGVIRNKISGDAGTEQLGRLIAPLL